MTDDKLDKQFKHKLEDYQHGEYDTAYWQEMQQHIRIKNNPFMRIWLYAFNRYVWISLTVMVSALVIWSFFGKISNAFSRNNIIEKQIVYTIPEHDAKGIIHSNRSFKNEGSISRNEFERPSGYDNKMTISKGMYNNTKNTKQSTVIIAKNRTNAINRNYTRDDNQTTNRNNTHSNNNSTFHNHTFDNPNNSGIPQTNSQYSTGLTSTGYSSITVPRTDYELNAPNKSDVLNLGLKISNSEDSLRTLSVLPGQAFSLIYVYPSSIVNISSPFVMGYKPVHHSRFEVQVTTGMQWISQKNGLSAATGQNTSIRLLTSLGRLLIGTGIGYNTFNMSKTTNYDTLTKIFYTIHRNFDSVYVVKVVVDKPHNKAYFQFGDKIKTLNIDTAFLQKKTISQVYKSTQKFTEIPLFIGHRFIIANNISADVQAGTAYMINTSQPFIYRNNEGTTVHISPYNAYNVFARTSLNYSITRRWGVQAYYSYTYARTFSKTPLGYLNWTSNSLGLGAYYKF